MESHYDTKGSGDYSQMGLRRRLQIVMSMIIRLINQFKITHQDLVSAGVNLDRMHD